MPMHADDAADVDIYVMQHNIMKYLLYNEYTSISQKVQYSF